MGSFAAMNAVNKTWKLELRVSLSPLFQLFDHLLNALLRAHRLLQKIKDLILFVHLAVSDNMCEL